MMSDAPGGSGARSRARATRPGRRLLIVAALFALALAAVGTWLAIDSYHSQRDRAIDSLSVRAQESAARGSSFISTRLQLLGVAAASPVFATGDGRRIDRELRRLDPVRLRFTGGLAWIDAGGMVRAGTEADVLGHDVLPEQVMRAAAGGKPVVGAADRSAALAGLVVPVATPTFDRAGNRNGELLGGIGLSYIRAIAARASLRYDADVAVVDRGGQLIAGPAVVAPRPARGLVVRDALRRPGGTAVDVPGVSGRPGRIVGWGSTVPKGWTLFLERDAGAVLGPARERLALTLLGLFALVAIGVAGGWAMARRLDRTAQREFSVALRLQLSLLPDEVPPIAGADIAVRYVPGTAGLEVGGDWYDVLDLGDGRAGLCVGDIVGRGLSAAVVMGRLRSALAALAVGGAGPTAVLRGLERYVERTDATPFATVAYAELDPRTRRVRYASAGHPPGLIIGPGDATCFVEGARGTPLGTFSDIPYEETELTLPEGATLVLYTDGLVERRDEPIDRGLGRLRALAVRHAGDGPDALADALLRTLAGTPADDVAILCLRIHANGNGNGAGPGAGAAGVTPPASGAS